MRTIKKVASHIFIDGFGGMTQGLFATLIIGTMIQQIGLLIGGSTGNVIYLLGKAAAALTSAGIGVGVAVKYGESPLVTVSAAVAAMIRFSVAPTLGNSSEISVPFRRTAWASSSCSLSL